MKFHLITGPTSAEETPMIEGFFKSACEKFGVEYIPYDVHVTDPANLSDLGSDDMLYRSKVGPQARLIERLLISQSCSHFYTNWAAAFNIRGGSYYLHKKLGLPVIPTVPFLPKTNEGILKAVDELGQFPIIVKAVGGSNGVGVMRIDSLQSLRSVLDYLRSVGAQVLLRKYVPHEYYARMVVVGDKVVASHTTYTNEEEFRTNAGKQEDNKREARVFSDEIQNICVKAVHAHGSLTGGVDLLFDEKDNPYIAEVNFPNDFGCTQKITGIDIAGEMISYLMKTNASTTK